MLPARWDNDKVRKWIPQNVLVDVGHACSLSVVIGYDYVKEEREVLEQAKTDYHNIRCNPFYAKPRHRRRYFVIVGL